MLICPPLCWPKPIIGSADYPIHLLLPLAASLLFVCGLLFVKRASQSGIGPWTVTMLTNFWAALLFSFVWIRGGEIPPWHDWWQPCVVAGLYILGQIFTFAAIEHGDVSVATPIFGIKVIVVAVLLSVVAGQPLALATWGAVLLAFTGILLVQWTPRSPNRISQQPADDTVSEDSRRFRRTILTIIMAVSAASCFGTFDVVVQSLAAKWGAGRLLPISFWIAGVLSIGFLPFTDHDPLRKSTRTTLLVGSFLVAAQALCLVFALGTFNDAARINVVYTLRGVWGVVLAWIAASIWGGAEALLPKQTMLARLMGAGLLTAAVLIAILWG